LENFAVAGGFFWTQIALITQRGFVGVYKYMRIYLYNALTCGG